METLLFDPNYSVTMKPYAPVKRNAVGGGAVSLKRQWPIPYYEFTIGSLGDDKQFTQDLAGFLFYHQGDRRFLFDGGEWGNIETPILVDFTDGARTQYYAPYRNLFGPSWLLTVNGVVNTDWTVVESSGLFVFGSPPPAGVLKGKGRAKFECVFWYDGETIYESSELADRIYDQGKIVIREIP